MFLFLRYNRIAQIAVVVVLLGLIGGGSFFFLAKKSEKVQATKEATPTTTVGGDQSAPAPVGIANNSIPKSDKSVGDITYAGNPADWKTPFPDSRAVVGTDPKSPFKLPGGGHDLKIRRTNLPITTYYAAILHKESVAELIKMYTEVLVKAGYTQQGSTFYGDVMFTKKVTDPHKAFNANIFFTFKDMQANLSIQSPVQINDTVMPSMVEIKIDKQQSAGIGATPNPSTAVSQSPSPTASAGVLK